MWSPSSFQHWALAISSLWSSSYIVFQPFRPWLCGMESNLYSNFWKMLTALTQFSLTQLILTILIESNTFTTGQKCPFIHFTERFCHYKNTQFHSVLTRVLYIDTTNMDSADNCPISNLVLMYIHIFYPKKPNNFWFMSNICQINIKLRKSFCGNFL